ncbi:SH3 domain-containing protein [Phormidium tenue FACHB-886]|nr:SH3 domain-containing protein [Phormidium tenue FACHB-886]
MSLVGVSKFVLGVLLAIALLAIAGMGATRYLLSQIATPPPKPIYANDPSPQPAAAAPAATPAAPAASPTPAAAAPSPVAEGYPARVTQPIGLILRQDPGTDAVQVGGVEFNQELTVLEDAPDGAWQRVRLANGAEGWVKGGNTERLN